MALGEPEVDTGKALDRLIFLRQGSKDRETDVTV